ncbi:MAG: hypothetical protein CMQ46_02820 [Gammaproteobacteria bacterium]|nr:hypothetical protein [Gammaproteobacteria bacterium]MBJ54181.1 hypothetical protein [Gammaproteobacteria bacterium]HBN15239.1 hypothetical protein [Pseudohongiella sp.]
MFRKLKIVVSVVCCALAPICWAQEPTKQVENEFFLFYVPSDMQQLEGHGIDSFVQRFESENIKLSFDYGRYSNNFNGWPEDTRYREVVISGKPARIGTVRFEFREGFPFSTKVYFPLDGQVALSMLVAYKSEGDIEIAHAIFDSIVFKPQPDNQ